MRGERDTHLTHNMIMTLIGTWPLLCTLCIYSTLVVGGRVHGQLELVSTEQCLMNLGGGALGACAPQYFGLLVPPPMSDLRVFFCCWMETFGWCPHNLNHVMFTYTYVYHVLIVTTHLLTLSVSMRVCSVVVKPINESPGRECPLATLMMYSGFIEYS